jgi:hypothetical protein
MAVRFSALRAGHPLHLGWFLVLISVRGWVVPRAILRLEGLDQLKNRMSSLIASTVYIGIKHCASCLYCTTLNTLQQLSIVSIKPLNIFTRRERRVIKWTCILPELPNNYMACAPNGHNIKIRCIKQYIFHFFFYLLSLTSGARGSVVGWDTMLEAEGCEFNSRWGYCNYSTHKAFSVCYVFTSRCLVTDPNNFPASVLTFLPADDYLITNSLRVREKRVKVCGSERHYIWGGGGGQETVSPVLKVPRQCPLVLLI